MEIISSKANEKVKAVKALHLKKNRDETGLYLAEGVNILADMPKGVKVRRFFVTDTLFPEVEGIISKFNAETVIVTEVVMAQMSDTDTPSGILAVIEKPENARANQNSDSLVLDGVADCGNLGTIIRTAVGADFLNVYLIGCADVWSPKTVRASMGGVFRANLIETDFDKLSIQLDGCTKVCLDMSGSDIFEFEPKNNVALFLGNEAHGLSQFSRDIADTTLSLPMANGQESLNVAVAAGVSMYVVNHNKKIIRTK